MGDMVKDAMELMRDVAILKAERDRLLEENAWLRSQIERKPLVAEAREPAPCWHDFTKDLTVNFCRKCGRSETSVAVSGSPR